MIHFLLYLLLSSNIAFSYSCQNGMGGWGSVLDLSKLNDTTRPEDTHTDQESVNPYEEIEYESDEEEPNNKPQHKLTFAPSKWQKQQEQRQRKKSSQKEHSSSKKHIPWPAKITLEIPIQKRPGRWFTFTPNNQESMRNNVCMGTLAGTPPDMQLPKNSLFLVIGKTGAIIMDLERQTLPQSEDLFKKIGTAPVLAVYNTQAVYFKSGHFTLENSSKIKAIYPK